MQRADKNIVLLSVLGSAAVLTYFFVLNRFYFSSRLMSPIFRRLLLANDFQTAWAGLGICMLAALWAHRGAYAGESGSSGDAGFAKAADFVGAHADAAAAVAAVLLSLCAVCIYGGSALSMDEYAAVFQAKVFAAGQLTAHLPPAVIDWLIPRGFNGAFLVASHTNGMAMEAYWPGFALLLAPFELCGVPWLCNALLGAASLWLMHRITLELTASTRAAGWSMLFAGASGVFVATAISFYSMQAHMTANLLFAWLLLKPTAWRAFIAGSVGSLALVLHNPFPHALFAAPWIVGFALRSGQRRYLPPLLMGYLPLLLVLGAGWLQLRAELTSGDSGFNVLGNNLAHAFRLPTQAIIDVRTAALVKMWLWAVPCLFLFALRGAMKLRADRRVQMLTASAVLTFAGYLFVIYDQGHGWGYRYFHSAWGVVPILAGCAFSEVEGQRSRLAAFAGTAVLLNFLCIVPLQLWQMQQFIAEHAAELPPPQYPGRNVYFVHLPGSFYIADLVQTDPLLRERNLVLFSRGAARDADLRQQNWPDATRVAVAPGVEEWHVDSVPGGPESPFTLAYSALP